MLDNPKAKWSRPAYTQVYRGRDKIMGRSVRTERWRYTEWNGGADGAQLYDHKKDPFEYRNLADDPDFAKVRSEMRELLSQGKNDKL